MTNELKFFSTRVPEEDYHYLKIKAAVNKVSIQELITKIFKEWIDEQNKKEGNK